MINLTRLPPPWVEFPNIPSNDPRYVGEGSQAYADWIVYVHSMDREDRLTYFEHYGVPESWILITIDLVAMSNSDDDLDAAVEELMPFVREIR